MSVDVEGLDSFELCEEMSRVSGGCVYTLAGRCAMWQDSHTYNAASIEAAHDGLKGPDFMRFLQQDLLTATLPCGGYAIDEILTTFDREAGYCVEFIHNGETFAEFRGVTEETVYAKAWILAKRGEILVDKYPLKI